MTSPKESPNIFNLPVRFLILTINLKAQCYILLKYFFSGLLTYVMLYNNNPTIHMATIVSYYMCCLNKSGLSVYFGFIHFFDQVNLNLDPSLNVFKKPTFCGSICQSSPNYATDIQLV